MEDRGIEPLTPTCKAGVFPISTNPPNSSCLPNTGAPYRCAGHKSTPIPKGIGIYTLVGVVGIDPTSVPYQDTANPSQLNSHCLAVPAGNDPAPDA